MIRKFSLLVFFFWVLISKYGDTRRFVLVVNHIKVTWRITQFTHSVQPRRWIVFPDPQAFPCLRSKDSWSQIIKFAWRFLVISILSTINIRLVPFHIVLLACIVYCSIITRLRAFLQSMTIRTAVETARIIFICSAFSV